ncbi:hypothetical protein ACGFX7_05975 [Streptomyces harbinensis]|uniref:hypothetical protein n=1 Tax=Streptomyces harbinensis TaxID=1176198 RepID=UPI00371F9AB5
METIAQIRAALGPAGPRFTAALDAAPLADVPAVVERWRRIATDTEAAVARGREMAQYDARGAEPPGTWTDRTDRVRAVAAQARTS